MLHFDHFLNNWAKPIQNCLYEEPAFEYSFVCWTYIGKSMYNVNDAGIEWATICRKDDFAD